MLFITLLLCLCSIGCRSIPASTPWGLREAKVDDADEVARARQAVVNAFPREYRAVQRAIITVHGKQFVCDGLMTVSADRGWELAIVNTLGLVTKVRVTPTGAGEVLKATPLFREEWSREFVLRDLRCLFVPPSDLHVAGRMEDGSIVLESPADAEGVRARCRVSPDGERWERLELVRNQRCIYRAIIGHYRTFSGRAKPSPSEIEVHAGAYDLDLRIVQLTGGS